MPPNTSSSDQTAVANWLSGLEAAVAFALIIFYIWWLRFRYPYAWIPILVLVIASQVRKRENLRKLGFRWNTRHRFSLLWFSLVMVALGILTAGLAFHTMRDVSWQGACLGLVLYCVWGLFQQYVLNGYFVNRFSDVLPNHPRGVPILAGVFFSLAHLPNWFLMMVTLPGGYVCARLYLQRRNLFFLGLAHGVIGFLIYLAVPDTITHHLYVGPKWFG
jgi:hypothetical protein